MGRLKAFLLAAGEGRRMRPLTSSVPKCLLPVRGTPLLGIWLELLGRHGVTDVLVNLHHLHEQVGDFLRSAEPAVRVTAAYEERLLGSAGTVLGNREFVDGEAEFLVIYADNLTNVDLSRMVRFHRDREEPLTLGVVPTDRPWEKGIVVVDEDGRAIDFEEKPARPRSRLANAGIYVARPAVFDYFPEGLARPEALDFGFHVLPRMRGRMNACVIHEFLVDIGTPAAYEAAEADWPGL